MYYIDFDCFLSNSLEGAVDSVKYNADHDDDTRLRIVIRTCRLGYTSNLLYRSYRDIKRFGKNTEQKNVL